MGDVGSLALGGALGIIARTATSGNSCWVIMGACSWLETLSVILQVGSL